jgi:hypothetical protein
MDISKLELDKVYEFKGCDWSEFTCKGKILMSSPNAPLKYRNKRKFYILNRYGGFEPDRKTFSNIEFYREIERQV